MSSYNAFGRRKNSVVWEKVIMLDDYFGSHEYGVQFPDGNVYAEDECEFKTGDDYE